MGQPSSPVGFTVTGELLSVREGRSYEGRTGTVVPGEVALLVGDEVAVVRFPTFSAAEAATGGAAERQLLTLPVSPRVAGPKESTRSAWVEWRGRSNGHAD